MIFLDMRYLKRYGKMFEDNSAEGVPSWFIPLDQIGHWLDPRKGYIYPMLAKGGYDPEDYFDADEYFLENDEAREQFDEGQIEEILKDYRSSEQITKGKIDIGLVNEIVDLAVSEEIIDMGMDLIVWVWIDGVFVSRRVVSSSGGDEEEFTDLWIDDYEKVQKGGEVEYRIGWKNIDTVESYNAFKGFCQRLGAMHPDENITAGNKRVEEFRMARFDLGVLSDRMRKKG